MLALVSLGIFALGVGLSLLAAYLMRPKMKTQDHPPTSLALRGAYVPWIMSRRRVKPVFGWAGRRFRKRERMGKGKGGGLFRPKVKIYYEEGWHLLSVGPCTALYKIYVGNKAIFDGCLTPESHPSGTTIYLGREGTFTIYWGELDQPVNTVLGDSTRVGVASRWPGICYIHWNEKRLGEAPVWPMLEYVVERRPTGKYLTQSNLWKPPTFELTDKHRTVYNSVAGVEGYGYIQVSAEHNDFLPLGRFKASGLQSLADGDYDIFSAEELSILETDPNTHRQRWVLVTKIYPVGGVPTSVANETGTVTPYLRKEDFGANPAHVIADLLFEPWPYGLGQDQSAWDMDSLEAVGVTMENETIWSSWEAPDGRSAKELLGMAMQDLGMLIYQNPETGLLTFSLLRKATGTLTHLGDEHILPPPPEIESVMDSARSTKVVYTYKDVNMAYRQMTLAIDDDGQAAFLNYQNAQQIPIEIADHISVASKIAERRSQEELGNGAKIKIMTDRIARALVPGQPITIDDLEEVYRVSSVQLHADTNKVELEVVADFYGAEPSTFENRPGKDVTTEDPTQLNPLATFVEIPEFIRGKSRDLAVIAPVVRANYTTYDNMIYLSDSGTSYTMFGDQADFAVGGTLNENIPEDGNFLLNEGPQFTLVGPDVSQVLDLSGDETAWRRGRQICLIGEEICFLKKITAIGNDVYRLDGLIRARFDTRRAAHASGDAIFIFSDSDFSEIKDLILQDGHDLYMKLQPVGFNGEVPLDVVPPLQKALYGKGLVPMPPEQLRVTAPFRLVPAYTSGSDIALRWNFLSSESSGSGAGMQPYGEVCGEATVDGTFRLEILDSSDNLKRQVSDLTTNAYTYSNSDLVSDFGSEPTSFKVRVYNVRGGKISSPSELVVERI